ncbi:MAG TPA: hypothetical protein VF362_00585, partial [Demequinaceae bacterium]
MDDDAIESDEASARAGRARREPIPATGAWREGDEPGDRRFFDLGSLPLDVASNGADPRGVDPSGVLPGVRLAYETWGELNADCS